ncbi:MAG: phage major capsid protein [Erysipelotrichia bacterium]|nr:phage major capsid protein [Erysipelotrichia bacterium]
MENNKEQIKSDILAGQKTVEEALKANSEKAVELQNEIKSLAGSVLEVSNSMKEAVAEMKAAPKNLEVKMTNGEKLQTKSDDINEIVKEVKKFSNLMLRGDNDVSQHNFFEDDKFNNLLDKALEEKCFSQKKKVELKEDIQKKFKEVKQLGAEAKRFPILNFLEKKAAGDSFRSSVGADGGYVIKPAYNDDVIKRLYDNQILTMRSLARTINIDTISLDMLSRLESEDALWLGDEEELPAEGKPSYVPSSIKVGCLVKRSKVLKHTLNDSMIDIASEIQNDFEEKITEAEETAFYVGEGLKNSPKGLFKAGVDTDFASKIYTNGKIKTVELVTSTMTVQKLIDELYKVANTVKRTVRRPVFVMHQNTFNAIMTAKNAMGSYLNSSLMPRNVEGIDLLLGIPVVISDSAPEMISYNGVFASSTIGIFIGSVADTYTIVDRSNLITWVEAITQPSYYRYYSEKRVGGGISAYNKGRYIMTDSSVVPSGSSN